MRVLLLGATGQVGWELARNLSGLGELICTARDNRHDLQLDTGDLARLEATLDATTPDVIINATAYTAVDQAESETQTAMRLNAEVPAVIGAWAASRNTLVIHYSTDYVFDGSKDGPYLETDETRPLSVYGRSKLAGDQALLASGCAVIILRVSWVYGLRGSNFLLTMQRLMRERDSLNIVDDQIGAPTWCRTIAEATAGILTMAPDTREARQELRGVYHLAPAGHTSWYGFAKAIRDRLGIDCELHPIPASEYPLPAKRPMNSCLDTTKLEHSFGLTLPHWEQELAHCLDTPGA